MLKYTHKGIEYNLVTEKRKKDKVWTVYRSKRERIVKRKRNGYIVITIKAPHTIMVHNGKVRNVKNIKKELKEI